MKKPKIKVDIFKYLYTKTFDGLQKQNELLKLDLTNEFYEGILQYILNKGLIDITIRGLVTSGKSTVGLALMNYINTIIEKQGWNKSIRRYNCIYSDQTEYVRAIAENKGQQCVIIDEYSNLAEGGVNSTTEQQVIKTYQKIFAQKYLHVIKCTPARDFDDSAMLILEVLGRPQEGITTCKLIYNSQTDLTQRMLGIVNINVKDILNKKWYEKYRKKKFERMNLLQKHGVRDIRELEFAEVTKEVVKENLELAEIGTVDLETIKSDTKEVLRKRKAIYSMIGIAEISSQARSQLKLISKIAKCEAIRKDEKKDEQKRQKALAVARILQKKLTELQNVQEHLIKVYYEYKNIR